MTTVRIGCSGWNYPHWRERVYPKGCPPGPGSSPTPVSSTPSRSTPPFTASRSGRRSRAGRADPGRVRLRGQGEPLPHAPQAPKYPFRTLERTADWTFVRFHHGSRGCRGNYSETELEEWAQRIEEWRREVDVYAYFNNDWEGFAVANARWLRGRRHV